MGVVVNDSLLLIERSSAAQLLLPMAISLGFGMFFATLVTLLLIPINSTIVNDIQNYFRSRVARIRDPATFDQT